MQIKGAHFRLQSLQRDLCERPDSADAMDVTYTDPVHRHAALKLEMHYVRKLEGLMKRCSEKLLIVLLLHVRAVRQAFESEYERSQKAVLRFSLKECYDFVSAALDYTKIDSPGMKFGSGDAKSGNVVLQLGKQLRDACAE